MPSINARCQEGQNYAKKHNYAKYGNLAENPIRSGLVVTNKYGFV